MKIPARLAVKLSKLTPQQRKKVRLLAGILALFLLYVFLHCCHEFWFGFSKSKPSPLLIRQGNQIFIPEGSPLRQELEIKPIQAISKPHVVSLPGMVEADPSLMIKILPPLAGRLTSMRVKIGDQVHKNQLLAEMSSPDLAQADADHEAAESLAKFTSTTYIRAKKVYEAGGNSLQAVQQAENDWVSAAANAKRAAERLKILGKNHYSQLKIQSPVDGQVIAVNYGTGTFINDPTLVLMTVLDVKKVWVTVNIPENLIGFIQKGQDASIYLPAYPEHKLQGQIRFIDAMMDPDTRTNKTRIEMMNPSRKLLPNMYATIQIKVPQPKTVMIPLSSILMQDDTTVVFVEKSPWLCEKRAIQLGSEDGEQVRVMSGLKIGDRIVTTGGVFVNDK